MAICSKHTDPELRASANAMLRAAGYQVVDPLEETPVGRWVDAQRHYQSRLQKWKLIFIGSVLTTVLLAVTMLTLFSVRKNVVLIGVRCVKSGELAIAHDGTPLACQDGVHWKTVN
ncbi:MAG: hypothetical protein V4713_03735 [Pseudomonadota bacterium]